MPWDAPPSGRAKGRFIATQDAADQQSGFAEGLYSRSPRWLQSVMNAYADGLNYYLYKHPEVKPKSSRTFEPWMPLAFSDGSIGPDIRIGEPDQLAAFYGGRPPNVSSALQLDRDAIAAPMESPSHPQHALHHALLLINPHTSFFFRAEVQWRVRRD